MLQGNQFKRQYAMVNLGGVVLPGMSVQVWLGSVPSSLVRPGGGGGGGATMPEPKVW